MSEEELIPVPPDIAEEYDIPCPECGAPSGYFCRIECPEGGETEMPDAYRPRG